MKFFIKQKDIKESSSSELLAKLEKSEFKQGTLELELPDNEELEAEFSKHYSEEGLGKKLQRYARLIGFEGVKNALILYYALQSKALSAKHKAVIIGSLGYLISFVDVIPDLTPILGYSDDFMLISIAVAALYDAIDDETRLKATEHTNRLFSISSSTES